MANRPDFQKIKNQINMIKAVDDQLRQVVDDYEYQVEKVKRAAQNQRNAQAEEVRRQIPVEELNRDKAGIRVSSLVKAGYDTVWKVDQASISRLAAINGISEAGAKVIKDRAKEFLKDAVVDENIKLSIDHKTMTATQLVREIYSLLQRQQGYELCAPVYQEKHAQAESVIKQAKAASGTLQWLFSFKRRKEEAMDSLELLDDFAGQGYVKPAQEALSRVERIRSAEKAWDHFSKNAVLYYTVLEQVAGNKQQNTYFGLPDELGEAVEQVPLDLEGMSRTLRGYQKFGTRYIIKQKNVLLGDGMGLGKTTQAIASMVALRNAGARHFLVVCPASVLINWYREIEQCCDIKAFKVHGKEYKNMIRAWLEEGGIAVTTYETTGKINLDEQFHYGMLVVDEAHYVKNPDANRTKQVLRIMKQADRTLFMTGTPLENKVDEMNFLIKSLHPELGLRLETMKMSFRAKQYRNAISEVYLRRNSEDVLSELPELIENKDWCTMGDEEKKKYRESTRNKSFMEMRRVSWNVDDLTNSSKATRLLEICESAKEEGRKVIVFSFFRTTLESVSALLGEMCSESINGSMAPAKRQEIIDRFSESDELSVLLAQIQAGGTGLNIQAASVVVFCEPQLKPSLENQAVARAYRMGQVRNVIVHRLLCEKSVDEQLMKVLHEKQDIFDNYADESVSGKESLLLTDEQIEEIIKEETRQMEESA